MMEMRRWNEGQKKKPGDGNSPNENFPGAGTVRMPEERPCADFDVLVPKRGLEPPHPCEYVDLNHARLPIPPFRLNFITDQEMHPLQRRNHPYKHTAPCQFATLCHTLAKSR